MKWHALLFLLLLAHLKKITVTFTIWHRWGWDNCVVLHGASPEGTALGSSCGSWCGPWPCSVPLGWAGLCAAAWTPSTCLLHTCLPPERMQEAGRCAG